MQPLLNIVKWYTVQRIGGGMIKEDPYASMEKDQLISMIHFLVKREGEPTNEARVEPNSFQNRMISERIAELATDGTQELACGTITTHSNCGKRGYGFEI